MSETNPPPASQAVTTPAAVPTPTPAAPPPSLAPARTGLACVLSVVSLGLLAMAFVYFAFPERIQSLKGVASPSWSALFKQNAVWPGGIWSLTFGLAAAVGAYLLVAGPERAERDSPSWLRRAMALGLLAAGLAFLCVVGYHFARGNGTTPAGYWALAATVVFAGGGAFLLRTPPPPAPATGDQSLALVRLGLAGFVGFVGLCLLVVSYVYFVYPGSISTPSGEATATWATLFKQKAVQPVALGTLIFGLAALAGAYVIMTGLDRADRNTPAWVSMATAGTFLGAAAAMVAFAVYLFVLAGGFRSGLSAVSFWTMFVAAVLGSFGMFLLLENSPRADTIRRMVMGAGLVVGITTFKIGWGLSGFLVYETPFAALRDRPWLLALPAGAYFVGLLLVFLAVQPAATLVRGNQAIRWIVSWANMGVTTFLLLGLIVMVFVLSFASPMDRFFGRAYDWTASGFHSLAPITRNYLAGLREPVTVYVVMADGDPVRQDVVTMLDNCRSLNSNVSYKLLDTRRASSREELISLMERFNLDDPAGLLVVTSSGDTGEPAEKGEKGEKVKRARKGDYVHIKESELSAAGGQRGTYSFTGEKALMGAFLTLSEGQVKIYFTEGHGEWPLAGAGGFPQRRQRNTGSLATLRSQLADRDSVKVESLSLDKEIPKDANVVVIARPTKPFNADEVKHLRDYLKRQRQTRKEKPKEGGPEREVPDVTTGRLIVLMDAQMSKFGGKTTVTPSGLEDLLAEYGVKLGDDRLMVSQSLMGLTATSVVSVTNLDGGNPIAKAFWVEDDRPQRFLFKDTRTVEPQQGKGGATAEKLVLAMPIQGPGLDQRLWAETNLDAPPSELQRAVRLDRAKMAGDFGTKPISIAVTVSEKAGGGGFPMDKDHAGLRGGTEEPRMVVFGSSSWVTDEELGGQFGEDRVALFKSCVAWLNKGSHLGVAGIEDKSRKPYNPSVKEENQWWLYRLPVLLMLAAVVVIGAGVWVVRRR